VQVRVSEPPEGHGEPRDSGNPAVQADRVCQPDKPEHGQRLGNPPLCHRHLYEAGRGQIPHHERP